MYYHSLGDSVYQCSHNSFLCGQESGGSYSCQVANSFFKLNEAYTFQVAAENNEGVGSFSDPITKSIPIRVTSQGIDPIISLVLVTPIIFKLVVQVASLYNNYCRIRIIIICTTIMHDCFQIMKLLVSLTIN